MNTLLKFILIGLTTLLSSCGGSNDTKPVQDQTESKSQIITTTNTKIPVFNNVTALQDLISQNGIGSLRKWRGDEVGFYSSSDYFSFGGLSSENGMQNNFAYYLESEKEQFVQKLKLILNINNKAEKEKSLSMYSDITEKTFKSIGVEFPKGLLEACKKGNNFKSDNDNFTVTTELEKSKIDT